MHIRLTSSLLLFSVPKINKIAFKLLPSLRQAEFFPLRYTKPDSLLVLFYVPDKAQQVRSWEVQASSC